MESCTQPNTAAASNAAAGDAEITESAPAQITTTHASAFATLQRRLLPRRSVTESELGNIRKFLPPLLTSLSKKSAVKTPPPAAVTTPVAAPALLIADSPKHPQRADCHSDSSDLYNIAIRRRNSCHNRSVWPKAERIPVIKSTAWAPQPVVKGTSARDSKGSRPIRRATTFTAETTPACFPSPSRIDGCRALSIKQDGLCTHFPRATTASTSTTTSDGLLINKSLDERLSVGDKQTEVALPSSEKGSTTAATHTSSMTLLFKRRGSPLTPPPSYLRSQADERYYQHPPREAHHVSPMTNDNTVTAGEVYHRHDSSSHSFVQTSSHARNTDTMQRKSRVLLDGRVLGNGKVPYRRAIDKVAAEYRESFRRSRQTKSSVDHRESNYEYAATYGTIKV